MGLFNKRQGIIPACDVESLDSLKELVRNTSDLPFIQGFKIGVILIFSYGIDEVVESIREYSPLPLIYDHQKFGTDIPSICGGVILEKMKKAGVDGLIIFPHAGIETLKSTVKGCLNNGLVPLVGGEMTHRGYVVKEGGYLEDNAPVRIYKDAVKYGVEHFIIPGTKIDLMRKYVNILEKLTKSPKFLFPGVGSGQGGNIKQVFTAAEPHDRYAIIGRGIYGASEKREASIKLWEKISSH